MLFVYAAWGCAVAAMLCALWWAHVVCKILESGHASVPDAEQASDTCDALDFRDTLARRAAHLHDAAVLLMALSGVLLVLHFVTLQAGAGLGPGKAYAPASNATHIQ